MKRKTIYLLVGQKGSGKSFIGSLIDSYFGIKFIHVEDWIKKLKKDREIFDDTYIKEAFAAIEKGIRDSLNHVDKLVFESTGLTDYFDQMLENLKKDFIVTTIGIKADSEICLDRVRKRDKTSHINISDEQVKLINAKVKQSDFQADFEIYNETENENKLIAELKKIIQSTN